MQLLTTKSLKKHSRICILMKMKVVVVVLLTERVKSENGESETEVLLCELRVRLVTRIICI
jgi:hypothetical protein